MSAIKQVTPRAVAEFQALRWDNSAEAHDAVIGMGSRFGWSLVTSHDIHRGRRRYSGLIILGRNRKRYTVISGEWIIALGANGSIRVCSDKKYRHDYREVEENE